MGDNTTRLMHSELEVRGEDADWQWNMTGMHITVNGIEGSDLQQ